jgi:hypothetical protein
MQERPNRQEGGLPLVKEDGKQGIDDPAYSQNKQSEKSKNSASRNREKFGKKVDAEKYTSGRGCTESKKSAVKSATE